MQVDKNVGGGYPPASFYATNSQIMNNIATSQGGGINAATTDGIALTNTELSGNFGEQWNVPITPWVKRLHDLSPCSSM